ncbi:unnamed protein product [Camellia sinensis]
MVIIIKNSKVVIHSEGLANAEQDHQQWPPLRSCGIMYNNNIYDQHGMPSSSDSAFGFEGAHHDNYLDYLDELPSLDSILNPDLLDNLDLDLFHG